MAEKPSVEGVLKFIERSTPRPLIELYASMEDFDFPIDDAAAFHEAVESAVAQKRLAAGFGQLLRRVLQPIDFPLSSVRGALEKLNFRLPPPARLVPLEDPFEPGPATRPAIRLIPGLRVDDPKFGGPWLAFDLEDLSRLHCIAKCDAEYRNRTMAIDPNDPERHKELAAAISDHIACRAGCR